MARIKKRVNFTLIQKSILNLFEKRGWYYNYSWYCTTKCNRSERPLEMELIEIKLNQHAEYTFPEPLPNQLNNFFELEIAPYFNLTRDESIDNVRQYNWRYVNKECKKKRWKIKLSQYIHHELEKIRILYDEEWHTRDFLFEIIMAFIYDAYNIKKI